MNKKLIALLLDCVLLLGCVGCGKVGNKSDQSGSMEVVSTVTRDTKFNSAILALSPEEFEEKGFELGDSCDIEFENGYSLTDVPIYNGYYVKNAAPIVVEYPGFGDVRITLNNLGIFDQAELAEGMSVTIRMNAKGKYMPIQEALGQLYSFDRTDYDSDVQFTNFRALTGGRLKADFLFRGASPVDNSRNRAPFTDRLLDENAVRFVIDLADSEEDIAGYMAAEDFASDYFVSLYGAQRVALLDMGSSYQSEEYQQRIASGLRQYLAVCDSLSGPDACRIYIHCMEGKDRTGFVCMLLEALAGATYDEMLADYMITYDNYYDVTKSGTPEKYDAIADLYFNSFAEYLYGLSGSDSALTDAPDLATLKAADYTEDAAAYLRSGGMTDAEIMSLLSCITQ